MKIERLIVEFSAEDEQENVLEYLPTQIQEELGEYLKDVKVTRCSIAPDEFVQAAQERHCFGSDDEIEIDEPANMSEGEDGVWIQGWLFVPGLGSAYVDPEASSEPDEGEDEDSSEQPSGNTPYDEGPFTLGLVEGSTHSEAIQREYNVCATCPMPLNRGCDAPCRKPKL